MSPAIIFRAPNGERVVAVMALTPEQEVMTVEEYTRSCAMCGAMGVELVNDGNRLVCSLDIGMGREAERESGSR